MEIKSKSITEKLMIVRLSIHQWYPTKIDKKAMIELAKLHNIDPERAGKMLKNLVDLESIRPLQQACRALRNDVHDMTAPWDHAGNLALPADMYFDFTEMVSEHVLKIERLADDFKVEYAVQRENAPRVLNGLFNEDDYPEPHVMRARFGIDFTFKPVLNPNDIRAWGIGADAAKEIEQQVTADIHKQVEAAQWHVMKQVMERAQEFIEKITAFDDKVAASEDDGKGIRLHDSAIDNLRDVMQLVMSGLNFSGDQEIENLCKQLTKSLKGVNPGKLKVSTDLRKKSIADVEKVLVKFRGVF